MDGQEVSQEVADAELSLLGRAFLVLEDLLMSDNEQVRLQSVKAAIRLVEVMRPADVLSSAADSKAADSWRGLMEGLDGLTLD